MIVSTFFSYCMSLFSFLSSLSLYPCVPYHSRLLYVCFFTLTLFNLPSFFSLFVPIKALSLSSLSLSLCTLSQSLALCMFLHSNSFCLPSFFPLFAPIKLRLSLSLYSSFLQQIVPPHTSIQNMLFIHLWRCWNNIIMFFPKTIRPLDCQPHAVWPEKNRQMFIKVGQNWFL